MGNGGWFWVLMHSELKQSILHVFLLISKVTSYSGSASILLSVPLSYTDTRKLLPTAGQSNPDLPVRLHSCYLSRHSYCQLQRDGKHCGVGNWGTPIAKTITIFSIYTINCCICNSTYCTRKGWRNLQYTHNTNFNFARIWEGFG